MQFPYNSVCSGHFPPLCANRWSKMRPMWSMAKEIQNSCTVLLKCVYMPLVAVKILCTWRCTAWYTNALLQQIYAVHQTGHFSYSGGKTRIGIQLEKQVGLGIFVFYVVETVEFLFGWKLVIVYSGRTVPYTKLHCHELWFKLSPW